MLQKEHRLKGLNYWTKTKNWPKRLKRLNAGTKTQISQNWKDQKRNFSERSSSTSRHFYATRFGPISDPTKYSVSGNDFFTENDRNQPTNKSVKSVCWIVGLKHQISHEHENDGFWNFLQIGQINPRFRIVSILQHSLTSRNFLVSIKSHLIRKRRQIRVWVRAPWILTAKTTWTPFCKRS